MSRTVSGWIRTGARRAKRGFTLVELLVVMAIIGLLVGLLVPAVFGVQAAFNRAAVKFEIQALNDAVENYRSKHGDYPPDGSSWPVMEAHLRKAFPNILVSELNLLNPSMFSSQVGSVATSRNDNDTMLSALSPVFQRVMDPAEVLVFFLGGFSSDGQRPFTGPGGPFAATGNSLQPYGYNVSRQNSFYEFPTGRLTLDTAIVGSTSVLVSTDETLFGEAPSQGTMVVDLMPVFMSKLNTDIKKGNPYVYFDSRTYQSVKGGSVYFNFYQPSNVATAARPFFDGVYFGAARPYFSEQANVALTPNPLFYENKATFQILSPGRDGRYGGLVKGAGVVMFTSKGNECAPITTGFKKLDTPNTKKFFVTPNGTDMPSHDNAGNFTETNTLGENAT